MATSGRGKATRSYESVGMTYDGVRVLRPRTKATHFTAAEARSAVAKAMAELAASKRTTGAAQGNIFVEPRSDGDYAVKRARAKPTRAVLDTQAEANARAKELAPETAPLVKRVRNTKKGAAGKWRKA